MPILKGSSVKAPVAPTPLSLSRRLSLGRVLFLSSRLSVRSRTEQHHRHHSWCASSSSPTVPISPCIGLGPPWRFISLFKYLRVFLSLTHWSVSLFGLQRNFSSIRTSTTRDCNERKQSNPEYNQAAAAVAAATKQQATKASRYRRQEKQPPLPIQD